LNLFNKIFKGIAAAVVAAFFFACESNTQEIPLTTTDTVLPTEVSLNTTIMLSDSAILKLKVVTPKLVRYSKEENPYVEFPQGLKLIMYDSLGEVESTLDANYGVNYPEEKRVEVKNDVVVKNSKDEVLNTEHLIWLRDEGKIYTEEFVKISTPDEIIYGDGLESNESFTKYRIKNIRGTISVNTAESDSTSIQ
jgi:LPS export ABC transporter protein LptC